MGDVPFDSASPVSVMRQDVGVAWVVQDVLDFVIAEAERALPFETGGAFLGYWSKPEHEVVVTHAVGPGPKALHARDRFVPDSEFHEKEIAYRYTDSERLLSYLGDWHSHPQGTGSLSSTDRRTLKLIADHQPARATTPIMGVLSTPGSWWLRVWSLLPRRIVDRIAFRRAREFTVRVFGSGI